MELIPKHFYYIEDAETLAMKKHPEFGSDFVSYKFNAVLKCNNKKCYDTAMLVGKGNVLSNPLDGRETIDSFYPEYCSPPPVVFEIPESTPESIKKILLSSFSIFFSDPENAANKLRCCLEKMLIEEGIEQSESNYSLNSRIQKLCKKYSQEWVPLFNAIKYIGDSGSHHSMSLLNLTPMIILDAYEITEHLLEEIYHRQNNNGELQILCGKYQKKT